MKRALKLLGEYILFYVIGTLLGTIIYMIYQQLLVFVSGGALLGFSLYDFPKYLCYVAACFVFIITPVILYYRIKRRGTIFQLFFYLIVSLVFWNLLMPFSYKGYLKLEEKSAERKENHPLTKGIFRESDGTVYFFAKDYDPDANGEELIPTVVIETEDEYPVSVRNFKQNSEIGLVEDAVPYRDIVVKERFSKGKNSTINIGQILERGMIAWNKGITFWIGFMMLGFALCSLYAFVNFSSWKLVNTSIVITMTLAIIIVNTLYFLPICDGIRNSDFAESVFFVFCERFVDDPILNLFNLIIGLVCILLGIISLIVHRRGLKKSAKGE